MTCATCPNCGFDLERLQDFEVGDLAIAHGCEVRWRGKMVRLTSAQTLIVRAIAADVGLWVSNGALAEVIGYDGDEPGANLSTHFHRIRHSFREIDPIFDMIERCPGRDSRGTRWRAEAP